MVDDSEKPKRRYGGPTPKVDKGAETLARLEVVIPQPPRTTIAPVRTRFRIPVDGTYFAFPYNTPYMSHYDDGKSLKRDLIVLVNGVTIPPILYDIELNAALYLDRPPGFGVLFYMLFLAAEDAMARQAKNDGVFILSPGDVVELIIPFPYSNARVTEPPWKHHWPYSI